MVVVDCLTKYAHFMSLTYPYTAKKIVEVFITNIVPLHGIATATVSNRDLIFFE